MRYYVNLPISWIHNDKGWVKFFRDGGLNPELGFDALSMGLPLPWHKDNASRLKDSGLACVAHLPFFGPVLGQEDAQARRGGIEVLKKAADIAAIYEAAHLIGHPSFFAHSDADVKEARGSAIGPQPGTRWLESSLAGWEEVLAITDARLYLENTYDTGPEAVLELLELLSRGDYHDQAAMCFDLGHWFSFAQGCDRHNLQEWLDRIAPRLAHLHLHDNSGHGDQHLGLGQGGIPLHDFFRSLLARGLKPTFTLEPHCEKSLRDSLRWIATDAVMCEWMAAAGYPQGLLP